MANKKVTLVIRVKTDEGWRRYVAVMGNNGRVRPGYGIVKGVPVEFKDYSYEARYYTGSKMSYEPVGTQATLALSAVTKKGKFLAAKNTAIEAGITVVEEKGREKLADLLDVFVKAAEHRGAMEQAHHYRITNDEFLELTERVYADQVTTNDFMKYQGHLRKEGFSDRTIFNRHVRVKSFLTFAGVSKEVFPSRAPRYEKSLPEVYTEEELKAFFTFLTNGKLTQHQEKREQYLVIFRIAHQCGLRERELMHIQWSDVKFSTRILQVRSKPDWGFLIKDKEERDLPIPQALVELLQAFKEKNGSRKFITGTQGDKPNSHLLRTLKRVVNAAGLNCGECRGCDEQEECEKWFLHKFRATYATQLLRGGLDIRSVQKLMGHSDLESTMRYLRPAEDAELQSRVNAMSW